MIVNTTFAEEFKNNFIAFKDKKIVLYGLGQKTHEIVENLDFNFIGLLDKDPENIGKTFWGLKVLSYEETLKSADLIIIVASFVNFHVIFSRIEFFLKEYNIPIYFCDGSCAQSYEIENVIEQNVYWQKDLDSLKAEIDKHDVISFDIFDTLLTRKIMEPADLFKVMGKCHFDSEFHKIRIDTEANLNNFATLEIIYKNMPEKYKKGLKIEQEMELLLNIARKDIVEAFNYALKQKKDVYLISDTYHKRNFIKKLLKRAGVKGYKGLLVSCELGKRKSDKTLWKHYLDMIQGQKALHIGDNLEYDVVNAEKLGVNVFHIFRPYEMLANSTLNDIASKVCTIQQSIIVGNIISKIFNSPFALSKSKGRPSFNSLSNIGYVFYAPILFAYLMWVLHENINNKTDKLLFVARDGYFIEKLYNLIVKKFNIKNAPKSHYLITSRVLTSILNLDNEQDIEKALQIRFQGKTKDYFKIRFGIDIDDESEIQTFAHSEKIKKIVELNKDKILKNAKEQKKFYLRYLDKRKGKAKKLSIIEPGFRGTNQFFISKLLNLAFKGYYCAANLSENNPYFTGDNMFGLFQKADDKEANKSNYQKYSHFIENGIFVAPTGTPLNINKNLSFEFSPPGNTQLNFHYKKEVFNGVIDYFNDIFVNFSHIDQIDIDSEFIDFLIGEIFGEKTILEKYIKDTFYGDSLYEQVYDRKLFE